MKLVSLTLVKNEEYWIWYVLTALHPWVDRLVVCDNCSTDSTLEVIRGMPHIQDKLELHEGFKGDSEVELRDLTLDAARAAGGTHVLIADGDEVWPADDLRFCRDLLNGVEHRPPQPFPWQQGNSPHQTGGVVRHLGVRPLHPSYEAPNQSCGLDWQSHENEHSCYNFTIRFMALDGLKGNSKEWRYHGYVDADDFFVQASPHTLWLPRIHYFHFMLHPRSRNSGADELSHRRPPQDIGARPMPSYIRIPEVLYRKDGPTNPVLEQWGLRP